MIEAQKKCFKCGEVKALSLFYKHPMMADGHVNKCKECNKADVHKNRADNIDNIREYDRTRRKKGNVTEERWAELSSKLREYRAEYYGENPEKLACIRDKSRKVNCTPEQWAQKLRHSREYLSRNTEAISERSRKYREDNPKKYAAHMLVGNSIRGGRLIPQPCEVCGELRVHGHHMDYDKPLEVVWLCSEHHLLWHSEHGEGANAHN